MSSGAATPPLLSSPTAALDTGRLLALYGQAGALKLRQWRGTNVDTDGDNWSPEVIVEPAGLRGDPTAVHVADATWVAYQTTDQAVLRGIWFSGDHPTIGPRIPVAESRGAEPTLTSFAGELALFLWRGPNRPFGLRMARLRGRQPEFGREEESGFSSLVPVAAVEARERQRARSVRRRHRARRARRPAQDDRGPIQARLQRPMAPNANVSWSRATSATTPIHSPLSITPGSGCSSSGGPRRALPRSAGSTT